MATWILFIAMNGRIGVEVNFAIASVLAASERGNNRAGLPPLVPGGFD